MNAITKPGTMAVAVSAQQFDNMLAFCQKLIDTKFLPDTIATPEQAAAIILTGQELGIEPMYALRTVNVIKGKPTLAAELQLALFKKSGGQVRWDEVTVNKAELSLKSPGDDYWHTETFDMKDAQTAGLAGGFSWKKYPKAMLKARCISAAIRAYAPNIGMGLYIPEEMQSVVEAEKAPESPEVQQAEVVEPPEPKPQDKLSITPEFTKRFLKALDVLGSTEYYAILKEYNVKEATDLLPGECDKVIEAMNGRREEIKEAKKSAPPPPEPDEYPPLNDTQKKKFATAKKLIPIADYKNILGAYGAEYPEQLSAKDRMLALQDMRDVLDLLPKKPATAKPDPENDNGSKYFLLKAFKAQKERVGTILYYRVMEEVSGKEHANEIGDNSVRMDVLDALKVVKVVSDDSEPPM